MTLQLPDITPDLRLMVAENVFYDPWLAAITQNSLDPRAEYVLELGVGRLLAEHWTETERTLALGLLPVPDRLVVRCLRDSVLATSRLASVSCESSGNLDERTVESLLERMAPSPRPTGSVRWCGPAWVWSRTRTPSRSSISAACGRTTSCTSGCTGRGSTRSTTNSR